MVKNLTVSAGNVTRRFDPRVRKIPWRRKWQPAPVFLLGRIPWTEEPSRLQSAWGCKESVVTEWLSTINGGESPEGCDGHGPGKFLCEMTSELLPDCQEGVIQWKFRRPYGCGKKE